MRPAVRTCRRLLAALAASATIAACSSSVPGAEPAGATTTGRSYPNHTDIVATTFWVGEIFDPNAPDGSQVLSTYDGKWLAHYGGCDGVQKSGRCDTERRTAANDYFPQHMTPRENPFYLDLPFDDINDETGFRTRCQVIPWADDPGFAGHCDDHSFSYLKNHWVRITGQNGRVCYGQIEDAGPGTYQGRRPAGQHAVRRRGCRCLAGSERLPWLRRPQR
jgi:hypothetical protein